VQAIGRQPQRALDGAPVHYERHRPEQTTLYRLVLQHAASFIAQTEASTGAELPLFIKDEFDALLECSILVHGFLRLRCGHLLGQAGLKADEGHGGAVTLIQRFGSAANLNVHLHCLVLDGVYRCGADGTPSFVEVDAPTDDELRTLLQGLITRLMKLLTRRGVLVEEMGQTYLAEPDADADADADADEARTLRPLQAAAVTYRIAFGPRAGQKVLTLRGAMPREGTARQPLCADIDGFSLHAAGAAAQAASDPLPWRAGTQRQASGVGGAARAARTGASGHRGHRPVAESAVENATPSESGSALRT
jgi:hypothetical protein